jgi:hypothetical protein
VLANPIESARVTALLLLDASGGALGTMGIYLSETIGRAGSMFALAAALVLWTVLPLGLAAWILGRRDL